MYFPIWKFYLDPLTINICGVFVVICRHAVNNGEGRCIHSQGTPSAEDEPSCALPSHFRFLSVSICVIYDLFMISLPKISKHYTAVLPRKMGEDNEGLEGKASVLESFIQAHVAGLWPGVQCEINQQCKFNKMIVYPNHLMRMLWPEVGRNLTLRFP